ncbi:Methionyl-tRNA formyltransferase, partial [Linderina macrospora]
MLRCVKIYSRLRITGSRSFSTSPSSDMRVLFFGTDEFSNQALKALDSDRRSPKPIVKKIGVVCPPPTRKFAKGRQQLVWQALVEKTALERNFDVHHPNGRTLSHWQVPNAGDQATDRYDIGVVSSFGMFIPRRIIESFPLGMINIHPSLLPEYRGPSPLQAALLDGRTETGITIQEVHPNVMDGGKVLAQVPYQIDGTATRLDLMNEMGYLSGQLLVKLLHNYSYVRERAVAQDESKVTTTRLYNREDSQVIWEHMTAEQIVRMHRAFCLREPVHTIWRKKNKMHSVQLQNIVLPDPGVEPLDPEFEKYPPGSVFYRRKVPYLEVPCVDGKRIWVKQLQVQGRTTKTALEFVNGYLRTPGAQRFLTSPVEPKKLTPKFEWPEGTKPEAVINAERASAEHKRLMAEKIDRNQKLVDEHNRKIQEQEDAEDD